MSSVPKAFQSKAKRKAHRKTLRAGLANRRADKAISKESKAEFYRNLRIMKQRRYEIHKMVAHLDTLLAGASREALRVGDRVAGLETSAALTSVVVSQARKHARSVAGDVGKFARQSIYQPVLVAS
jgi:hypothetical protein